MIKIVRIINSLTSFKLQNQNLIKKTKYHHFSYLGGHSYKMLLFVGEKPGTLYSGALETSTFCYLMSKLLNEVFKISKNFGMHFKNESWEVI